MLWKDAKSDWEKSVFKIIYKSFANTSFNYNDQIRKTNKDVFKGSV